MRTDIPEDIVTAFANPNGIHPSVRMTVYKNRHFFERTDLDTVHAASFAQMQGIHDVPLAQDVKFSPPNNVLVSVFASGGTIWAAVEGHDPVQITEPDGDPLETDDLCRPALWCEQESTSASVYFYRPSTKHIRKAKFAVNSLLNDDAECVTELADYNAVDVERCSLHATDLDDIYALTIYEGGVKITNITGNSIVNEAPRRIMHPTKVWDADSNSDVALLNFSGAIYSPGTDTRLIYLSNPVDGNVWGVEWYGNGWSDVFEALPADLSRFKIANVVAGQNGTIHMCGQFQRVDNVEYGGFASSWIYGFDLWSADGRTFSLDRFTLFALGDPESDEEQYDMAYRFQMAWKEVEDGPTVVYYADANRILSATAPSSIAGNNAEKVVIDAADIRRLQQAGQGEYEVTLRAGSENYFQNALIKLGARVVVEMGTLTADGGREYYQLDDCIVTAIPKTFGNAKREQSLRMVSSTLWRTSVMTHPFYLEINSKQSLYDDVDEFDNLYMTDQDNYLNLPFMVDFWDKEPESPTSHDPGTATLTTLDMITRGQAEYPKIELLPINIKVFGWSRAGGPSITDDGSPGDDTPTDPNATNDAVQVVLKVIHSDESEEDITITTAKTGETVHFPCGWQTSAPGYYPVTLIGDVSDSLKIGDQIKTLSVNMVNENTSDKTTFYIERVEIPEVFMSYSMSGAAWEDDTAAADVPTTELPERWEWETGLEDWEAFDHPDDGIWNPDGGNCSWADGKIQIDMPNDHESYFASESYNDKVIICTGGSTAFEIYGMFQGFLASGFRPIGWDGLYLAWDYLYTQDFDGCWSGDEENPSPAVKQLDLNEWGIWPIYGARVGRFLIGGYTYEYNPPGWLDYMKAISFIEHQTKQGNLEMVESYRLVQYYEPGATRYSDGLHKFVVLEKDSDKGAIFKISGPSTLGEGRLKVTVKYVEMTENKNNLPNVTATLSYDSSIGTYSPCLAGTLTPVYHSPGQTFDLLGEANTFYGSGYFRLKLYTQTNGLSIATNSKHGFELQTIIWVGLDATETVLWAKGETPETPADEAEGAKTLNKIGSPAVLLATKPYSTFGFKAIGKFEFTADCEGVWGGVVGLAKDGDNYILARASKDTVQLIKMRSKVATVLASESLNNPTMGKFWIMLEHKQGHFDIFIRLASSMSWGAPVLSYDWKEVDGPLAVDADMMHVGAYAFRETPFAQITGYAQGEGKIGIIPVSERFFDTGTSGFPDEGYIRIGGVKYHYTGKILLPEGMLIGGPYQCRNTGLGDSYSSGGASYSGNSVEFTRYEELANVTNYNKFNGTLMGTDIGETWQITKTDFHPTTNASGTDIILRNRAKFFSPEAHGDLLGMSQKAWITGGLTGITLILGEATTHSEGEFIFLEQDATVKLITFIASSDHEDCTVEDLCERICKLAGGQAEFPIDTMVAAKTLSTAEWKVE